MSEESKPTGRQSSDQATSHSDNLGGDDITVGNISDSTGVAIGRGAQATVSQGLNSADLDKVFAPLMAIVHAAPPDKQAQAKQIADHLKQEAAKGKHADDSRMAKLIEGLMGLVPGAVSAVVSAFGSPILGGIAGPVTKFVLNKLQGT